MCDLNVNSDLRRRQIRVSDCTGSIEKVDLIAHRISSITNEIRNSTIADSSSNRVVSVSEIDENEPSFLEMQSYMSQWRQSVTVLPHYQSFVDFNNKLTLESKCIWEINVDLYRTLILFGYSPLKSEIRAAMIKNWLSHVYKTQFLDTHATIQIPAEWCYQLDPETGEEQIYEYINIISDDEYDQLLEDGFKPIENVHYRKEFIKDKQEFTIKVSRWMKYIKYKLGAFAASFKDNSEFPKNPLPAHLKDRASNLFDKTATRWLINKKNISTKKPEYKLWFMSLIDSICRGVKKGAPRAELQDCEKNDLETFNCFCADRPLETTFKVRNMDLTEEIIYETINQTLDDLGLKELNFEPHDRDWETVKCF